MSCKIIINGKTINVQGSAPVWADKVELHFASNRNKTLTRMTDISPQSPFKENEQKLNSQTTGDLFFCFIDSKIEKNSCLRYEFANVNGEYTFDPMRCKTKYALTNIVEIPAWELVNWENTLHVTERSVECLSCKQVYFTRPVACGFSFETELIADIWNGSIAVVCQGEGKEETIYTEELNICNILAQPTYDTDDKLQCALENAVDFLFNCKNIGDDQCSNGMYLFYDLDNAAYRAGHWNWTYGAAIGALLDCIKNGGVLKKHNKDELLAYAKSMADVILKFENKSKGHICEGVSLGRWQQNLSYKNGVMGFYSIADHGVCCKWGLMPLYKYTGDKKYMDYMNNLYNASIRWLEKYEVLPADYLEDIHDFSDRTLDETMFAMGFYQELYKETNNKDIYNTAITYFEAICNKLRLENGMWSRIYLQETNEISGFQNDTKGHGWAMEGLLCAADMGEETDYYYLEQAKSTADLLIESQYADGHWDNFFQTDGEAGFGEKSTALWSWLLYRLYNQCGEDKYRQAAKKALYWSVDNMYTGTDMRARGSIVANSFQSGIIYRDFYNMSCTYTSSFFILAAICEQEISAKENDNRYMETSK